MKKLYYTLLSILVSFVAPLHAQVQSMSVDTNNVSALVNANGVLFSNLSNGQAGFEFPKGSGVSSVYAAGLWLSGADVNGQLHVAAQLYGQEQEDFFYGPLTVDGTAVTTDVTMAAYNRVWLGNRADIDRHIQYFQSVQNGTNEIEFPQGYSIPQWILEWPAMGNTSEGQALFLSPFLDFDGDLVYDPEQGDYPLFPGDECAYFIINDNGGEHALSGALALGVEIHVYVYSFHQPANPILNNTVFVRYQIINRSTISYSDVRAGIWSDLDLGNPTDDYIGCDVQNAAFYTYNGDGFDEPVSSSMGYGENIPVQVVSIIGGPYLPNDLVDNLPLVPVGPSGVYGSMGPGFGDNVPDNERMGMTSFLYYNNGSNPVNGNPTNAIHFDGYLKSIWKNGAPVTYGGTGTGTGPGSTTTSCNYMFPGVSDPLWLGTAGTELTEWSETTSGNPAGDRRGLAAIGPFALAPNEEVVLDVAYTALDTIGSAVSVPENIAAALSGLRALHQSEVGRDDLELRPYTGIPNLSARLESVSVFPNPTVDELIIAGVDGGRIEIYNGAGQLCEQHAVGKGRKQLRISTTAWASGLYVVRYIHGTEQSTLQVVKN